MRADTVQTRRSGDIAPAVPWPPERAGGPQFAHHAPDVEHARALFSEVFGRGPDPEPARPGGPRHRVHVVRAPGRVNLIGEHTDYNDGLVLPMAIEQEVWVVCRARDDDRVRLASTAYPAAPVEFSLLRKILPDARPAEAAWAEHGRGIVAELIAAGIPLSGMDALIASTLPVAGGLASSAAVEVAVALALLTLAGLEMDPVRLALICQKAEHEFAGVPCGIMDPMVAATAKLGHAMLLDCRSLSRQQVALDPRELRVVIADTMARHTLSEGWYARRRAQCEQGVGFFHQHDPSVRALRDVTPAHLDSARGLLPDEVLRRCRHVVTENARTAEAATRLGQRNYEAVGDLMAESHRSLRDDYQVSTPELDFLVEQALGVKGVYGARMTGAGRGGCVIALAQPRAVPALSEQLTRTYSEQFGHAPAVSVSAATAGASVLE